MIKSLFIKLVTGQAPRIKVGIAAAVTWLVTWLVTKFALQIGPDVAAQINNYVAGAVWLAIEAAAAKLGDTGIKKIQDILPPAVLSDGHVGDVTVGNVKLLAEVPLTKQESLAVKVANFEAAKPPTAPTNP